MSCHCFEKKSFEIKACFYNETKINFPLRFLPKYRRRMYQKETKIEGQRQINRHGKEEKNR